MIKYLFEKISRYYRNINVKPKVRTHLALQYCDLTTNPDN